MSLTAVHGRSIALSPLGMRHVRPSPTVVLRIADKERANHAIQKASLLSERVALSTDDGVCVHMYEENK